MATNGSEFHDKFKVFLERVTGPRSVAFTDRRYLSERAGSDLRLIFEKLGSAGTLEVPGAGRFTIEEVESDVKTLANALIVPPGKFAKTLLLLLGAAFLIAFIPALLMSLFSVLFPVGLLYAMFSFLVFVFSVAHRLAIRNVKEAFAKHAPILKRLKYLELYLEFTYLGKE